MMKSDHPLLHNTICIALSKLGHQHLPVMSQPPSVCIIQLVSTSTACLYINKLDYPLPYGRYLRVCLAMTIIPNLVQHLPPITHCHLHSIMGNKITAKIASTFMISAHHSLPNHPLMLVIFARHQIYGYVLQNLRKRPP